MNKKRNEREGKRAKYPTRATAPGQQTKQPTQYIYISFGVDRTFVNVKHSRNRLIIVA